MATVKTNHLPALASCVIRPALVEAKLMTEKHARDAVYVVTLVEELGDIEMKIAAMEAAFQADSPAAATQQEPCRAPENRADAHWIRAKSSELDLRLRRIEQLSKQR